MRQTVKFARQRALNDPERDERGYGIFYSSNGAWVRFSLFYATTRGACAR